jgi:hypothetical protein
MDQVFGGYREVTPIASVTKKAQRSLGVEFVLDPSTCCFASLLDWNPTAAGSQARCGVCKNVAKAVTPAFEVFKDQVDPETGTKTQGLADGLAFHAIVYDPRRWQEAAIDLDLDARGLRKDAVSRLPRYAVAIQRPSAWFAPETFQMLPLRTGSRAVIGQLREGFEAKVATVAEIEAEANEQLGIERY